ncbi:MAG: hypothetical protein AB7O59_19025 [Pirellulales bacterium]
MSRTMINFFLDLFLLLITVSLLFTSAVLRVVFPAASAAAGWTLWGYDYDAWDNLQFALISIIGLAVLLHVMMHWSWVTGVVVTRVLGRPAREAKQDTGIQTVWGVAMLIVIVNLVGALVGLAYVTIQAPPGS